MIAKMKQIFEHLSKLLRTLSTRCPTERKVFRMASDPEERHHAVVPWISLRRRCSWQKMIISVFVLSSLLLCITTLLFPSSEQGGELREIPIGLETKADAQVSGGDSEPLEGDTDSDFLDIDTDSEGNLNKDGYTEVKSSISLESGVSEQDQQSQTCKGEVCSQEQRFATLRKGCEKYPEISQIYNADDEQTYFRLLVDDKHKILYCALPKAASTTFYNMFYFAVTGRQLENIHCRPCWEKEGLIWLSRFSKEERDKRLKEYYKIMVVRHPLDRLVSCWNGKFTAPRSHATWRHNGPRMIEMFRQVQDGSTLQMEIKKGATFEEFVRYVNHLEEHSPVEHNQHWNAHYRLCHPCSIDYDLIIKVETMQRDSKFVLDKLSLNASEFPLINARRTGEEETLMLHKTLDEYKKVPEDQLLTMKQLYGWDMELFDYKWRDQSMEASCGGNCDDENRTCC